MEKIKNIKALFVAMVMAMALAAMFGLAACSGGSSSSGSSSSTESTDSAATEEAATSADSTAAEDAEAAPAAAAPGEEAGFTEYPIFEDEKVDFMNVSAVYFQPVPMTDGTSIEGYDLHLEADISALENKYGFGVGDWVPYLTVDYKVTGSDGSTAAEGTFMPMSASDGPHYGANIALPNADTYDIEFTFHSPHDLNYQLHTDAETGPGAESWDESAWPLTYTYKGWDYTPQEW